MDPNSKSVDRSLRTEESHSPFVGGYPSDVRKKLMKCIVKKLDDGLPIKHAINLCGLPKRTFYNWIDFGKEGLSEDLTEQARDSKLSELVQFYKDVERAKSEAIARKVTVVEKEVLEPDTALRDKIDWLARRDPENFAKQDRVEVNKRTERYSFDVKLRLKPYMEVIDQIVEMEFEEYEDKDEVLAEGLAIAEGNYEVLKSKTKQNPTKDILKKEKRKLKRDRLP